MDTNVNTSASVASLRKYFQCLVITTRSPSVATSVASPTHQYCVICNVAESRLVVAYFNDLT